MALILTGVLVINPFSKTAYHSTRTPA